MKNIKYSLLLLLLVSICTTSCSDSNDDLLAEIEQPVSPEEQDHGYSIGLTITLDAMGGRAATPDNDTLWKMENYIDPQKLRILFFDKNNKFMFESKNRWMKQIETSSDNSRWYVSVPFFSYGNEDNWDWENIKSKMMDGDFKIAILANRPTMEWCPDYDTLKSVQLGWFDNSAPKWGPADTTMTVYDLHRCQRDPMYVTKNYDSDKIYAGFYDFIQGGNPENDNPLMGATSSWVDYKTKDKDNKDKWKQSDGSMKERFRYYQMPSKSHPIPMYGIQTFKKIDKWPEGTTLNLTRTEKGDKPISLLRSVVKLELWLPVEPNYVLLRYSNVYARCEPLNVWTPTDSIWKDDHDKNETCEWYNIWKYGQISKNSDKPTSGKRTSKATFQKRIAWFYKEWIDTKQWSYPNGVQPESTTLPAPKIFNPCVQRNETVNCAHSKVDYREGYVRYVVYTGERNINDPSKLDEMGDYGTICTWNFHYNGNLYFIPLTEYFGKIKNYTPFTSVPIAADADPYDTRNELKLTYCEEIEDVDPSGDGYKKLPIPLLRNHVYRFKVGKPNAAWQSAKTRSNDNGAIELDVTMEHLYTEDISFK